MPKGNQTSDKHLQTVRLTDARLAKLARFSSQQTLIQQRSVSFNMAITLLIDALPDEESAPAPSQATSPETQPERRPRRRVVEQSA
jgi:hypothetical protein